MLAQNVPVVWPRFGLSGLTVSRRPENNAPRSATHAGPGVIAMRRLGIVAALGAVLGVFGAVVTASPALARGPKWVFVPAKPFTLPAALCGFKIGVSFPADKEFVKVLNTSDGSTIFLITGPAAESFTNLTTGKTITRVQPR